MIEILFGLLVLAAGGVLQLGLADHMPLATLLMPMRGGVAAVLGGLGALLVMHGSYRRLRDGGRRDSYLVRSGGLAASMLALTAAAALLPPLAVSTLNFVKAGGFPLGYYMAAQGSLILLVMLAFSFAGRQDTIDAEEDAGEEQGSGFSGWQG